MLETCLASVVGAEGRVTWIRRDAVGVGASRMGETDSCYRELLEQGSALMLDWPPVWGTRERVVEVLKVWSLADRPLRVGSCPGRARLSSR